MKATNTTANVAEHEKELTRLLAQRRKIDQRRDAVQAQINTIRKTIADIESAHKAAEELKLSPPWQTKFMRGHPRTGGRDVTIMVRLLTTQMTLAAIGREHGISVSRTADIVRKVRNRLIHPAYRADGLTPPDGGWGVKDIRASANYFLSTLRHVEEMYTAHGEQSGTNTPCVP